MIPEPLKNYTDNLTPPRPAELTKMEAWAAEHKFPIIGPACGQCCYLLSRLAGARRIFELGSGYGYSTAWFARAVRENGGGEVHHVVWDQALSDRARGHLEVLGYTDLVQYHVGEAVATLKQQTGVFDVIFNDIEKPDYPAAIEAAWPRLKPGGLLIVDNMVWSGRVIDPEDRTPATEGIREATRLLTTSDRWITSLVPLRDGLMVAMRA
jgi:predicted O-methyltransferase YrrM